LRHIMKTQSIYVPVTLYLAPFQGASPRMSVPRVETLG
jgi:hypothetical protein